ncbi:hypothetical protein CHLNCDRAFT_142894 [Chlorella variabilis]|uniref:30S ribosomal protein S21, chloroplastic n=1 Tax=Chlorella variabilis TaxID=554065 RepID=E1Z903_CHLVA|nr:hypothetical protein CHLNCDRAFT_142894 [Chlorella variabilis]EFN57431.1 hypothetical protein CHLNCDRAFT_142894 [Chlorella variabilis]|eukprot:XP_005849533.1 hypothetical protein CHLNCDRAFT_142894 [Chlorella variabilis]
MQALAFSSSSLVGSRALVKQASNGTAQKLAMKSRSTYQVQVVVGDDEPQDNALKRFRREVMSAGKHRTHRSFCVIPEVRRRRYFENSVDAKKRKHKESRMAMKRQQAVRNFSQVSGQEPAPFSDMFGASDDLDLALHL